MARRINPQPTLTTQGLDWRAGRPRLSRRRGERQSNEKREKGATGRPERGRRAGWAPGRHVKKRQQDGGPQARREEGRRRRSLDQAGQWARRRPAGASGRDEKYETREKKEARPH